MAINNSFEHEGKQYHIEEIYKNGYWVFSVHYGEKQVTHPHIPTTIMMKPEQIEIYDQRNGRGAFYKAAHNQLIDIVTKMTPQANEIERN